MYSAKQPGRWTPTPLEDAQRCRLPARQLRQRPQTTWPSALTTWPGKKSTTFEPTADALPLAPGGCLGGPGAPTAGWGGARRTAPRGGRGPPRGGGDPPAPPL